VRREAGEDRCTAALVLDVDPVGLVRRGRSAFALAEYVNDRPYVASSLMSVALVTVFKAAMEGLRPELAGTAIPFEAALPASTSASSRFWPWNPSPWTRASDLLQFCNK
jgi:hypothetical protein